MIDLECHSQATRLKKFGNLRSRAMLAITSIIIHYPGASPRVQYVDYRNQSIEGVQTNGGTMPRR